MCELKRMFVTPSYRRKGYGKALINAAMDYARRKGYEKIKLDSLGRLTEAMSMYNNIGFQTCEKYTSCDEKDHICMEMDVKVEATG